MSRLFRTEGEIGHSDHIMEPNKDMSLATSLNLIQTHLDAGHPDQADELLEVAGQMSSRDPKELHTLARLLTGRQKYAPAREVYLKLVLLDPSPEHEFEMAQSCLQSGWRDHGIIVLDRLMERWEDDRLFCLRASLHRGDGEHSRAAELYSRALALNSENVQAQEGALLSQFEMGESLASETLENVCKQLVALNPGNAAAAQKLAEIQAQRLLHESQQQMAVQSRTDRFAFFDSPEFDADCGLAVDRIPSEWISVILPVCNEEAYLSVHLECLMNQTLPKGIEIIVVDYGSSENEKALVDAFSDARFSVRYLSVAPTSLTDALNRGIKAARGRYVFLSRCGNTLRQDAIVRLLKALRSQKNLRIAYADWASVPLPNTQFSRLTNIQEWHHGAFDSRLICRVPVATGPILIERKWVEQLQYFHLDKSAFIHEFIFRTILASGGVISIPETLELYFENGADRMSELSRNIKGMRQAMLKDLPIERIYQVTEASSNSLADAWVAYGNWMLEEFQGPADRFPTDEYELAALCFERALDFRPLHDAAIQNLAITNAILGRLDSVLCHVEKLPKNKQEQVMADIDTYRRNFAKLGAQLVQEPNQFMDSWTDLNRISPRIAVTSQNLHPVTDEDTGWDHELLHTPVRWLGPFYNHQEETAAGIEWVHCLSARAKIGICHIGNAYSHAFVHSLPTALRQKLYAMNEAYGELKSGIVIYQGISEDMRFLPDADYHIGVAWCQQSRLSPELVRVYNQLDEIWVANTFLRDALLNSGVEQRKIQWMPIAVDDRFFKPGDTKPSSGNFQFLTLVDDPHRCGLDLTLKAFFSISGESPQARLRIYPCGTGADREKNIRAIQSTLQSHPHGGAADLIEVVSEEIPWKELPELFQSATILVQPYRHEVYGIELGRAVSCQLPVITTNHGGVTAYSGEGHFELISFQFAEAPESAQGNSPGNWVEPSLEELTHKLQQSMDNMDALRSRVCCASDYFSQTNGFSAVQDQLAERLTHIENRLCNPILEPVAVSRTSPLAAHKPFVSPDNSELEKQKICFEGSTEGFHSLASFNRQFVQHLQSRPNFDLSLKSTSSDGGQMDTEDRAIHIRNQDVPRFSKPSQGRWVHMHDWTLGRIPQDWVPSLTHADEIWVTSESQRRAYVDSGVDPSKLVIIPAGVDTTIFHTGVTPVELDGRKAYRFIFVGDGNWQRGADLLLSAYYQTFKGKSNVELVLVDTEVGHERSGLRGLVDQFKSKMGAPAIRYVNQTFTDHELAGFMRACQCFVYPYRADAMGLRVLQAMACGLPVIVTGGGATDDFVADDLGFRVPSTRKWVGNNLNSQKLVGRGFFMEADIQALGAEMTHVLYHASKADSIGRAAAHWVAQNRDWASSAAKASDRLQILSLKPVQKDSQSEASDAFKTFWKRFESLVESNELESAWNHMVLAIQAHPCHPDACHGLIQLCQSHKWYQLASQVSQWMTRWMPKHVVTALYPDYSDVSDAQVPPSWAVLPAVLLETDELPKLTVIVEGPTFDSQTRSTIEPLRELAHQLILSSSEHSPDFDLMEEFEAEWVHLTEPPYGAQSRNQILEKATGDWVLFLKSGEVIKRKQLGQLAQAVSESGVLAGYFPRIIHHGNQKRTREYSLRLFRNASGLTFTGNSLENLSPEWDALARRWDLQTAYELLYLEAHEEPVSQLSLRDNERRFELEALVGKFPTDPRIRLNLAEELEASGHTSEAQEHYIEIFNLLTSCELDANSPALIEITTTNLARIHHHNSRFESVLQLLKNPIVRKNGLTASMHYLKAKSLLSLGIADEAMVELTKAWKKRDEFSYSLPLEEFADTQLEDKIRSIISNSRFAQSPTGTKLPLNSDGRTISNQLQPGLNSPANSEISSAD